VGSAAGIILAPAERMDSATEMNVFLIGLALLIATLGLGVR
jgi:hypothetical protein